MLFLKKKKTYLCPSGYTMAGVPLLGWRRHGRPPHQRAFRRPDSGGGWLCSGSSALWGVGEEEKLQWCPVCGGDDRAGGGLQVRAHLAQVTKLIPWWNFDSALCVSSAVLHIQTYPSGPGKTTGGLWKVMAASWMSVLIIVMNVFGRHHRVLSLFFFDICPGLKILFLENKAWRC